MTTRAMPSPPPPDGIASSGSDSDSADPSSSFHHHHHSHHHHHHHHSHPRHSGGHAAASHNDDGDGAGSSSGSDSASQASTPAPAAASARQQSRKATAGSSSGRPVSALRRADSGSIIVPSDANVEARDEVYAPEDARTMSPRRSSSEVDRLGENARRALIQQAKELQESLLEIVDRVENVMEEHEKLEGGNRFLQSYIGELMQTSKLTASGAGKGKSRGRAAK